MVRGKGSMRDKKKVSEHPNYTLTTKKVMVDPTHLQLYKQAEFRDFSKNFKFSRPSFQMVEYQII